LSVPHDGALPSVPHWQPLTFFWTPLLYVHLVPCELHAPVAWLQRFVNPHLFLTESSLVFLHQHGLSLSPSLQSPAMLHLSAIT
jgi:hypothetical protein